MLEGKLGITKNELGDDALMVVVMQFIGVEYIPAMTTFSCRPHPQLELSGGVYSWRLIVMFS